MHVLIFIKLYRNIVKKTKNIFAFNDKIFKNLCRLYFFNVINLNKFK